MSNDTLQVFEGSLVPIVMEFQGLEGDIYIYTHPYQRRNLKFLKFFFKLVPSRDGTSSLRMFFEG